MANKKSKSKAKRSVGLGAILAGFISWQTNHSIGWLIFHVLLNWLYVVYYVAFYLFPWGEVLKWVGIIVIAIVSGLTIYVKWDKIKAFFKEA